MNLYEMMLVDGEARSREHPNTFTIPSSEDIDSIEPGDYVKVGLEREGSIGERFWVNVKVIGVGLDNFEGTIANDLVFYTDVVNWKDSITFDRRHVLAIMKEPK